MLRRLKNTVLALAGVGESIKLLREFREHHDRAMAAVLSKLSKLEPLPRTFTVMILWQEPEPSRAAAHVEARSGFPGFLSMTMVVAAGAEITHGEIHVQTHIPAGAWVVGFNCYLHRVFVGNEIMDLGMPRKTPMCRLIKPAMPGQIIRFTVTD